jgi:hypothetical protein
VLAAITTAACTTGDTGSIDLAASAAPPPAPPKKAAMPPPPKKTCATDMDCMGPKSHCDPARTVCVECASALDCTDPMRPACESDAGKCVECLMDADCTRDPMRTTCGPDSTCKPAPP